MAKNDKNFFEDTGEKIKDVFSDATHSGDHKKGKKGGSRSSKSKKHK